MRLQANELLIAVPEKLVISSMQFPAYDMDRYLKGSVFSLPPSAPASPHRCIFRLDAQAALCAFLLQQRASKDSFWAPYFRTQANSRQPSFC